MKRKLLELAGILLITGTVFVLCKGWSGQEGELIQESQSGEPVIETIVTEKELSVHVCGAVTAPGVYNLTEGSRIYEAALAAGGFLPEAYTEGINLARELKDGEQVRIPFVGEENNGDGPVNINSADVQTLCTIPGVGETKAKAIVSYREKNGPFSSVEELMKVSGIKEGLFEQISPYIKCE